MISEIETGPGEQSEVERLRAELARAQAVVEVVRRFQAATDRYNRLYDMEKPDHVMYMQAGDEMERLRERLQTMPLPAQSDRPR